MASSSVSVAAWVLALAFFTSFVAPWVRASASSQFHGSALGGLFRNKRQSCADGTYTFNGRPCCKCAAGQFLVTDCSTSATDTRCNLCQAGTYNNEPNNKRSCEPCTSCDHPDANLEVEEPCTPARNAKCKCKKDHYCESEPCKICHPCQECESKGIQSPCTPTQNTVCDGPPTGAIVGAIVGVLVAIAVAVAGVVFWKRKQNRQSATVTEPEERLLLKDVYRYLPEIADTIGWKEMERLAICSDIKQGVIESCKNSYEHDNQRQTLELLKTLVEKHGKDASNKLIQMLNKNGQRGKAEEVKKILTKDNATKPNPSV